MKRLFVGVFFLLVLLAALPVLAESSYMVTFQTTDCNGDTGMATVEIDRIHSIETVTCDPPHEQAKRKQVLVRSRTIPGSYDVFTVDDREAARIQQQIQAYMDARRKLLEKGNAVIIHRED
jgi:3D (Asp-Asp-Asp) domain-containing protein